MFATTARYALVLAFALGTIHFNGASARAEKCSTTAADDIETSLSWRLFSDALPDTVRTNSTKTISGGASFVRFSVRSYFTETSGSALSYSARSLNEAVVTVDEMCGSMLKINAVSANTATVRVTASANGMSATKTVTVIVADDASFPTSNNRPPEAEGTIADVTFTQVTSPISFVVSPYFSDPDGDSLSYTATSSDLEGVIPNIPAGDSTLTITAAMKGPATVTVTATDPGGLSVTQSFEVTIANSPLVAVGTIPDTTVAVGASLSLHMLSYFRDPDPKDVVTYEVYASFTHLSTRLTGNTLTITGVSEGSELMVVRAIQGSEDILQSFTVTVSPGGGDDPLAVDITRGPMTTIASGTEYTWEAEATDGVPDYTYSWEYATRCISGVPSRAPDDDPCVWQWIGAGSENSTLTRTITTAASFAGVRVRATDNAMPTASSVMDSVIVSVNHAPTAEGTIAARTITLGHPDVSFSVAGFFSDPDGNSLTYEASSSSDDTVGVSISGSTLTLTAEAVNTTAETVTVTATDPGGLSSPAQEFAVMVEDPPPGLTALITGDNLTSIESGTEYTWGSTVTGGTTSYTYSWHYATECVNNNNPLNSRDDPCTLQWRSQGSRDSYTRAITTTGDRAHIRLIVSDSANPANPANSVTKSIQLTVTQPPAGLTAVGTISDRTLTVGGSSSSFSVSSYFMSSGEDDVLTYSASLSPSGIVSTSFSGATLTISPVAAGTATVTVTAMLNGESKEQVFTVTVNNAPPPLSVSITSGPMTTIASGTEYTWEAEATDGVPDYTYRWQYATRCENEDESLIRAPDDEPCAWQWISAGSGSGSTLTRTITTAESFAGVRVTATDDASPASSVMDSVIVSVNHAPMAEGTIPGQTLILGHPDVSFDVARFFSDPDGNSLTYEPSSSSDDTVGVSISGSTLTLTAEAVNTTAETITVTATDPGGLSSPAQEFAVMVEDPPPGLTALITGPTSIESGTSNRWESTVTGGTTPYTYSWHYATRCVNNNVLNSRAEPCTLQWTSAGSGSSYTRAITTTGDRAHIRLIVSDSANPANSVTKSIQLTVTQPPAGLTAVGTISDRTLTVGGSSSSFSVSSHFRKPNADDILTYSVSSSNTNRVTASMSGATFTISPVAAGTATITVTATLNGESAEQSFNVTVNRSTVVDPDPNNSPVCSNIPDRTLTAGGSAATFNLNSYCSDTDNDDLTYSASSSNTSVATASVSGSTLTITPLAQGSATVTVTASDGEDDASQTVNVTVNRSTVVDPDPNNSPVCSNILDQTLTAGGSAATFDLDDYCSDPNRDNLTYSASSSNTSRVTTSVRGSTLTITPLAKGNATVTVTARDADRATATLSFNVTVPNRSPVAEGTMPARKLTLVTSPSTNLSVSSYFSDPDNDNLTYTASSSNTSRVTTSMSGATLTITAAATGTATVTVTASDGEDNVSQSFDVTVHPRPNSRPVVSSDIADQTLTAGGSAATFDLSDYFSDPDDDVLTYSASSNATSIASASVSGSTLTITPVSAGSATITVIARDPSRAGAIQSVGVTVSTVAGLSASISGSSSVTSLGSNTWRASVSEGREPYEYSWRYTRLCSNQGPGDRAAPPCTEWVSGGTANSLTLTLSRSTTLELTVTDDAGDSVTVTLSVSYSNSDL